MIKIITDWLGFAEDTLGPKEGWAVFPQGERMLARKTDILGGQMLRKRLTVLVYCNSYEPAASKMEAFARWAESSAPVLGEEQVFRVEDARLTAKGKDGPGRYEAKLIFEFTERSHYVQD